MSGVLRAQRIKHRPAAAPAAADDADADRIVRRRVAGDNEWKLARRRSTGRDERGILQEGTTRKGRRAGFGLEGGFFHSGVSLATRGVFGKSILPNGAPA